ncbi:hypothetical protein KAX35_01600, partial [candidate division WOR-3 bacterium]|nr:hypothetical protein [candidate division WOR-3 bacterium]
MRNNKKVYILIFMLIATSVVAGNVILRYDFSEPYLEKIGEYDRVFIEGLITTADPGSPMLPIKGAKILLPAGEVLSEVEVSVGDKVILSGNYMIEPGQKYYPLSYTGPYEATLPDDNIYGLDSPYPENIYEVISVQSKFGYNILILNLFPVEYILKNGQVAYYRDITVSIHTVPDVGVLNQSQVMLRKDKASMEKVCSQVDNPHDILTYMSLNSIYGSGENLLLDRSDSCDYVIITNQTLSSSFDDFVEFKNRRGVKTRIKTIEDIYTEYTGIDEQDKIRNFIIDAYQNWCISYVLLGGDNEIIPHRGFYGNVNNGGTVDYDIAADLYYSGLDGTWNNDGDNSWGEPGEDDLLMEVTVGRAAVATIQEVNNFTSKSILYQDFPVSNDCVEALMVGEDLYWNWGKFYKEEIRLGSSNYGYTTVGFPGQFNVQTLYDYDHPTQHWPTSQLISYLNGGTHLVNHLGHASVTGVMRLDNSDVLTSFTNNGVNHTFFIIYSQGCYCNSFDNRTSSGGYTSDAISEHFTSKIEDGAVAFLGNSRYGWAQYSPSTDGGDQRFDRQF